MRALSRKPLREFVLLELDESEEDFALASGYLRVTFQRFKSGPSEKVSRWLLPDSELALERRPEQPF